MITRTFTIPFKSGEIPAPAPIEEDAVFKMAWVEHILLTLNEEGGIEHILRKSTLQVDTDTGFLKAQTIFEDTVLLHPDIDFFIERIVVGVPLIVKNKETGEYKAIIRWLLAPSGTLDVTVMDEDEHGVTIESVQHNYDEYEILTEDLLYQSHKKTSGRHRKKRGQKRQQTAANVEEQQTSK